MEIENNFTEEKIKVSAFHSSEALKNEIGQRILNRRSMDWDFVRLGSKGSFIYLVFKPSCN